MFRILLPVLVLLLAGCTQPRKVSRLLIVFDKAEQAALQLDVDILRQAAEKLQLRTTVTASLNHITEDSLKQYAAVAFFKVPGDSLQPHQQADLQRYLQAGGGLIGVGTDLKPRNNWPWHEQMLKVKPLPRAEIPLASTASYKSARELEGGHYLFDNGRLLFVPELTFYPDGKLLEMLTFVTGNGRLDYSKATALRGIFPERFTIFTL